MSTNRRRIIGVIGGASAGEEVQKAAYQVGMEVARRDLFLVTGGLSGVMQAASRGLREGRSKYRTTSLCLGILPGDSVLDANPFLDVAIPTGMGIARNILVVRTADSIIAIDGESGTLSELAFAWQLGKPIVALSTLGGWAGRLAGQSIDSRRDDLVLSAQSPEEAVRLASGCW